LINALGMFYMLDILTETKLDKKIIFDKIKMHIKNEKHRAGREPPKLVLNERSEASL